MNKQINILVIMGSTRKGRFGEKPTNWIFQKLKLQKNVNAELIDLRDWSLPFFDESISPSANKGIYENKLAQKWANKIGQADGFIMVIPEYNHGYPGVLKNAIDYVYKEWMGKPVGFISYGGSSGGSYSMNQLKQVVQKLSMQPINKAIQIVNYWTLLNEKGELKMDIYEKDAEEFLEELIQAIKK